MRPPPPILDDRKSILIAFLAISESIRNFFFTKWLRRPFWMTENHFLSHFSLFQINTQLLFILTQWLLAAILDDQKSLLIALLAISDQIAWFFFKMAAGGHFGWPKITFDRISRYFRSIRNLIFFRFFGTKWLPAAILDDRKSLLITFLAISDQYATLYFNKMAAGGHFG